MSNVADLIARGAVHIIISILCALVIVFVAIGSVIAIGGTGGFTSTPAPDDPAWGGLFILIGVGTTMLWGLIRLRRLLISALDRLVSHS